MSRTTKLNKALTADASGNVSAANTPALNDNSKQLATTEFLMNAFTGAGKRSKAESGYQKLPGDVVLQWGVATITANQTTTQALTTYLGAANIVFPSAFSAAPYSIVGSLEDHSSLALESANFTGLTATGATSYVGGLATSSPGATVTVKLRWMAIGPA